MGKIHVKHLTEEQKYWLKRNGSKIQKDPFLSNCYCIELPKGWRSTCSIDNTAEIVDEKNIVRIYHNIWEYSIQIKGINI